MSDTSSALIEEAPPPASPSDAPLTISRPTRKSEWTLFAALAAVFLFAVLGNCLLAFGHWPPAALPQVIWFIGWALLIAQATLPLIVFAIASPWVGTVKASGPAGQIELGAR